MQLLRKSNLNEFYAKTAVTIGTFDGVHKGHQLILKQLKKYAKVHNLRPVVILFEPQPKEYFLKEKAPKRLSNLGDKIKLIQNYGIEIILCLQFNKYLKHLSALDFIKEILIDGLNAKYILIGDDFRFGYKQQGDFQLLEQYAKTYQYKIEKAPTFSYEEKRISSSEIRKLILAGNFKKAAQLLGHPYRLSGKIARGNQRGRTIDFPTINIQLKNNMAVSGVYVVEIKLNNKIHNGVANVGRRPTVDGITRLLEVFIFDFNQDVYNNHAEIVFLHWLRNEVKFESFEKLKQQIKLDVDNAKQWLLNYQKINHKTKTGS